jgi:RimJ/RimL family protein N-acetyltransferase
MISDIPRLETSRLVLDAHRAEDFEALAAMWSEPEVTRHTVGQPATRQESWFRLLRYRGLWPVLGFGYWAVREKVSGRYMGDVGFADFCRGLTPSIDGIPEAGWIFAPWSHGQGFASEAVTAALGWLDGQARFAESVCLIAAENLPSCRLAQRHGFRSPTTVTFMDRDALLFRRDLLPG